MKKPFKLPRKIWTKEEIDYLISQYDLKTNEEIAKELGKTVGSIERKANSLNLKKSEETRNKFKRKWKEEEIQFLKDNYGKISAKQIAEELGKSLGLVGSLAKYYGLRSCSEPKKFTVKTKNPWTENEIEFLKQNYEELTQEEIAESLGRTLRSVQKKMNYLGLKKRKRKNSWTKEEEEYLKQHYELAPIRVMIDRLNRSSGAIRKKAYELGLTRDISTYIEREIEAILKQENIEYESQVEIRGFVADFRLRGNKIIEVHGDYWHCNPRVYPEPKDERQRQNIKKDKIKHAVYKELGYQVLYIWELDINENYEEIVEKIRKFAVQ